MGKAEALEILASIDNIIYLFIRHLLSIHSVSGTVPSQWEHKDE